MYSRKTASRTFTTTSDDPNGPTEIKEVNTLTAEFGDVNRNNPQVDHFITSNVRPALESNQRKSYITMTSGPLNLLGHYTETGESNGRKKFHLAPHTILFDDTTHEWTLKKVLCVTIGDNSRDRWIPAGKHCSDAGEVLYASTDNNDKPVPWSADGACPTTRLLALPRSPCSKRDLFEGTTPSYEVVWCALLQVRWSAQVGKLLLQVKTLRSQLIGGPTVTTWVRSEWNGSAPL